MKIAYKISVKIYCKYNKLFLDYYIILYKYPIFGTFKIFII